MKMYHLLIIILLLGFPIYKVIKKIEKTVKKDIVEYKAAGKFQKAIIDFIIWIVVIPIVIYWMDRFNLFSLFKLTENINMNFDWLSFAGAYMGIIINSIFLLYVTKIDRVDNNENVRESQRPYLNIDFHTLNIGELKKLDSNTIYSYGNNFNDSIYIPVLKITNAGETVARINIDKMYVIINYKVIEEIENGKAKLKEYNKKIFVSEIVKRISIPSNKTIYIGFDNEEFNIDILMEDIKIKECYIEYKDLFGSEYRDKSLYNNGRIEILYDNSLI